MTDDPTNPLATATVDDLVDELCRRWDHVVVGYCGPSLNRNRSTERKESIITHYKGSYATCVGLFRIGMIRLESEFYPKNVSGSDG